MVFKLSIRKQGRKVSFKSKKKICITGISDLNSIETNNLNTSNSDDVIGNSYPPRINVHTESSLNKLLTFQKQMYIYSSTSINDERTNYNNTNEDISCNQNSVEVIDHTCDDNGNNLRNIEE